MSGLVKLKLPLGGSKTISAPDSASDEVITLPAGTKTLATVENFTSTGIDDNATSTAITIDASENVGIGTTTPAGFEVRDKSIRISKASTVTAYRIIGNDKGNDLAIQSSDTVDGTAYTSRLNIMNDGRGLSQFTAKAWVNFNGTGTVAIRDSHNVSSVRDDGVGSYRSLFANNMSNTNYSTVASSTQIAGASTNYNVHLSVQNDLQVTGFAILIRQQASSDSTEDSRAVYWQTFGD